MKIRRVVTGHDQNGKAIVSHDELCTNILSRRDFHQSCVVWSTGKLPVDNLDPADGYARDVSVLGKEDSVFRIVQYDQVLHLAIIELKPLTMLWSWLARLTWTSMGKMFTYNRVMFWCKEARFTTGLTMAQSLASLLLF